MATFGSLFAGIGGIDLGLERAGWECRWQVEWDTYCQRVLAKHWPDIPRYGDITGVDWSGVERVDLIAGGFPCQPFSVAGRRRGTDDERWLWPEFARAVRALQPRLVLVENVPGLLAGGGMGSVLGALAASGYDAEWDSIPAAAVGAPHLRYRVWIVAHRAELGWSVADADFWRPFHQVRAGRDAAGDGGEDVAYAERMGSDGLTEAAAWNDANGDDPRWSEEAGWTGERRGYATVPDTDSIGREGERRGGLLVTGSSLWNDADRRSSEVSNAPSIGWGEGREGRSAGGSAREAERAYGAVVDTTGVRQSGSGIAERSIDPAADRDGQAGESLDGGAVADSASERRGRSRSAIAGTEEGGRALGRATGPSVGDTNGASPDAHAPTGGPRRATGEPSWWSTEPRMGGTLDGFSAWLDGHRERMVTPHMLDLAHAVQGGPREALRAVWRTTDETAVRDEAGGSVGLSPTSVLLTYLRQLQDYVDGERLSLARSETQADGVRGVWSVEISPRPPRRRSTSKQRPDQSPDALHALSQVLARHAQEAWATYRRENAGSVLSRWAPGWEDGIPRVATGVPARVDRLRALGNAVVPQVVEVIGRQLLAALEMPETA